MSVGYTSRYTSANLGSLSNAQGRKWPHGAWYPYTNTAWADAAICSSGGESAATSSSRQSRWTGTFVRVFVVKDKIPVVGLTVHIHSEAK